ncbi:hypothetical protein BKH46_00375 [Helicobacter sp. 12S02634-8]|uniref:TonB-dependent receptor n=1 Tax=Helicobacter sp. 12S02634-8 TaxID=1476199 RepID=UPI000BA55962|nr:TonB-dependent receptor [Helicobacter sp. 12S02634-8]PAF48404.1 hypothetical protein BKH46_00375 [Helicobacter sp. 12S02634-8]
MLYKIIKSLSLASSLVFASNATQTQTDQTQTQEQNYLLQTQIVSANKFDQNLREIDGSIALVNGKKLGDLKIFSTQDLSKILPGFVLKATAGPGYVLGSIRGISSTDYFNPSLVIYVDGIPQDPAFLTQELLDVKRVELLRGPQGTIWGQNAQAGVLNIITNPITSNTPHLHASTSVGTLAQNAILTGSAPLLKDWLYVGGNIAYQGYSGQLKREGSNKRPDDSHDILGNLSIALTPKDSGFQALFKYSIDSLLKDHHDGFFLDSKAYKSLEVSKTYQIPNFLRDVQTYALKLQFDFKNTSLTNVLSYQDRFYKQELYYGAWDERRGTWTDELRLVSQYAKGGYSIFGLYFQNLQNNITIADLAAPRLHFSPIDGKTKIDKNVFALYGEGKTPQFWGFDFTLGLRYSFDASRVHFSGKGDPSYMLKNKDGQVLMVDYLAPFKNSYDSNILTPKVALGYDINANIRLYALYQNGYKAGGFFFYTSKEGDKDIIKPEYTQNAEIGIHSEFWDNKISLNAAAYYIYTTNKQVLIGIIGNQTLKNIGTTDSKGLELQVNLSPIESLQISLGGTFGHSRYIKAIDYITHTSLKNNTLSYAPDITINANIDWAFVRLAKYKFFLNLNGNFYSKMYFDESNTLAQDPYALLDASIRVEMKNGLNLSVYVQNIFNQKYANYGYDAGSLGGGKQLILGDLRNIGLGLSYRL